MLVRLLSLGAFGWSVRNRPGSAFACTASCSQRSLKTRTNRLSQRPHEHFRRLVQHRLAVALPRRTQHDPEHPRLANFSVRVFQRRARVFAWVLLDNLFHLFFRIQTPSLSAGMHDFESGYAAVFNRRHERHGPLFQGRFHDVVVENESHAWELTRYVHLNPCRAQLAPRPEAWAWSSYRHYLDPRGAPEWLDWPTVLAERSHREAVARIAYKRFVEAGLGKVAVNPLEPAVDGWILGSEAFVKRVQAVCLAGGAHDGPQTPDEVIAVVAEVFETSVAEIRRRGRHGNSARDAAMALCRELLAIPASQVAEVFGVSASGL